MSQRNEKPASPLGLLLMSLILLTILSGCFRTPPPQDRDDSVSNTGGPSLLITAPADGAELSGATFFAVQVLRDSRVENLTLRADDAELVQDAPGETQFRRFVIPADYPAGELVLEATAMGKNGRSTTRSITVEIVPEPPSSGVLGETAITLGDYEENGALSTVTFPGGAGNGTVTFGTRTQEEIFDLTGVDYDSLGVTFLGAQAIEGADSIDRPLGISSGGYGPMVQPGQTVVNYLITPGEDGDGGLMVINGASVAPNGDIVSNPVPQPQVSDTVAVGTSSRLMSLASQGNGGGLFTQQTSVGGPPGTALSFEGQGFNTASPLSTKAVFCPEGTDIEYEAYVLVQEGEDAQTLNLAIPPLPPGPATLRFINETTGYETEAGIINVEAAEPLEKSAAETIDGYLAAKIDALLALHRNAVGLSQSGIAVNQVFIDQLESLITNFRELRGWYQEAYASSDPQAQAVLQGIAASLQHAAATQQVEATIQQLSMHVRPQMNCDEAEQVLSDALDAITMIDATIAVGACVSVLATGIGAAGCLFGAAIFFTGMAIDYTDIIPDCDEPPPLPPLWPPGGGPGGGGSGGGPRGGWFTGMGSIVPRGGVVAGNISPGYGPAASTSSLLSPSAFDPAATSVLPTLAGRYNVAVYVQGETTTFIARTGASGYFYIPSVPVGEEYIATATDVLTGATREIRGTGPAVGDSQYLAFDFGPVNSAPVALSGGNRSAKVGDTIVLDATSSFDPDGDPLAFSWELVSGPTGSSTSIDAGSSAVATLLVDVAGSYEVELTVGDGLHEVKDTATISASEVGANSPPVADAGVDQYVDLGDVVALDGGSSSDPDGDALTYQWTLSDKPVGSSATLSTPTAQSTFTPDVAGTYIAKLDVSDGTDTSSASVEVIVSDPSTSLSFGASVFEPIAAEVHTYSFSGEAGQLAVIYAARSGFSLIADVDLSLAGGGVLDSTTFGGDDGMIALRLPQTGQYLIEVDAHDGYSGAYTLDLQQPPLITVDSNVSGELEVDERKFYSFEATAGLQVKTATRSDTSMVNKILDLEGNVVTENIGTIPADATYLLMIVADTGGATYKSGLAVIEAPMLVTFSAAGGYGRALISRELKIVGDEQYYLFDGTAGDGAHAALLMTVGSPLLHADLELLDPGEQQIGRYAEGSEASPIGNVESVARLSETGEFLLKVEGGSELSTGDYQLRIDLLAGSSAITVDDDLATCPTAHSQSLPAALAAITSPGKVTLCEGVYAEPLGIRLETDGVTLEGTDRGTTVISATNGAALQVLADNVSVANLTVRGRSEQRDPAVRVDDSFVRSTFDSVTIEPLPGLASIDAGIDGLGSYSTITNSTFTNALRAIEMVGTQDVTITGNLFQGTTTAIYGYAGQYESVSVDATISDNEFHVELGPAIFLSGSGHTIELNEFEATGSDSLATMIRIVEAGKGTGGSTTISGNTITWLDSDDTATAIYVSMSHGPDGAPANVEIERNFFNLADSAHTGGRGIHLFVTDGSASVRNNVLVNTASHSAIRVENVGNADNLIIANNSIRTAAGAYSAFTTNTLIYLYRTSTTGPLPVTIVNNVLQGARASGTTCTTSSNCTSGVGVPRDSTIDGHHNLFFDISAKYRGGGTSSGTGDIIGADPMFDAGDLLTVDPLSPAVDGGVDIPGVVPTVDFDGTTRPVGVVDIGAYEQ